MKKIIQIVLFLIFVSPMTLKAQDPLKNIQERITDSFNGFFEKKDGTAFDALISELKAAHDQRPANNLISYWYAYALYRRAITEMAVKNEKRTEKLNDQAIELMEGIKRKSSEDYALLATVTNYSLAFTSFFSAPFKSKKAVNYADDALALDKENLRAYLMKGVNDFYTPKRFGGGKHTVEYLEKAISLPDKSATGPYAPTWGKSEAYWYLIRFYWKEGEKKKAKEAVTKASGLYPNDVLIRNMRKLIDKEAPKTKK
ncbi:hypothetical protein FUAX_47340 (plasmid) [Fulvitalea axinellae]|uniref:Tetratricopeptide repeat protein n=1 Tax=Fulvitalea axinellae TaxID=1182444 RepID=A0AAU9CZC2_9BACT|nr:hypothetical protein FUAX_47340 [Fulvitalea axinellae]